MHVRSNWNASKATDAADQGGKKGVSRAMQDILDAASLTVPIETGALRDSASIDVDEATLTGSVSYDSPYAVAQHEGQDQHRPPGRSKWLELTLREQAAKIEQDLAVEMREAFK